MVADPYSSQAEPLDGRCPGVARRGEHLLVKSRVLDRRATGWAELRARLLNGMPIGAHRDGRCLRLLVSRWTRWMPDPRLLVGMRPRWIGLPRLQRAGLGGHARLHRPIRVPVVPGCRCDWLIPRRAGRLPDNRR